MQFSHELQTQPGVMIGKDSKTVLAVHDLYWQRNWFGTGGNRNRRKRFD